METDAGVVRQTRRGLSQTTTPGIGPKGIAVSAAAAKDDSPAIHRWVRWPQMN